MLKQCTVPLMLPFTQKTCRSFSIAQLVRAPELSTLVTGSVHNEHIPLINDF